MMLSFKSKLTSNLNSVLHYFRSTLFVELYVSFAQLCVTALRLLKPSALNKFPADFRRSLTLNASNSKSILNSIYNIFFNNRTYKSSLPLSHRSQCEMLTIFIDFTISQNVLILTKTKSLFFYLDSIFYFTIFLAIT